MRSLCLVAIVVGAMAIVSATTLRAGDFPGFAGPQTWVTGSMPTDLEAGLIDADPILDLAVVNHDSNTLTILRGLGDGTFELLSTTPIVNGAESLALADYNNDGRTDVAVGSSSTGDLAILLNAGDGMFDEGAPIDLGVASRWIKAADFNGDGNADLVVSHVYESGRLSMVFGNGDGTFQPPQVIELDGGPINIEVHDINADGRPDLGVSLFRVSGYVIQVLLNDGVGGFQAPVDSPAPNRTLADLSFGDLDGDGIADCATANNTAGSASTWKGAGDGTFTFMSNLFTNGQPRTIEIVDLNDDHANDIIVGDIYLQRINAISGDGNGNFAPHMFFAIGARPTSLVAADFDGDGFADVAATHEFDQSQIVTTLTNLTLKGDSAVLVDAEAAVGAILFGSEVDLDLPSQGELLINSGFGETIVDLHHLDLRISAVTSVENPTVFNIGMLSHINANSGIEQVRFLNYATGRFEVVAQHNALQSLKLLEGIDAANYVSPSGEIEMSIKQIVLVPFVAYQFHNFMQWVDISVE